MSWIALKDFHPIQESIPEPSNISFQGGVPPWVINKETSNDTMLSSTTRNKKKLRLPTKSTPSDQVGWATMLTPVTPAESDNIRKLMINRNYDSSGVG